jgi:Ala-tRNA(Pro) deacylase
MHIQEQLFALLKQLHIPTETFQHEAVFTVEQAQTISGIVPGAQCKNLFLKDNNKKLWLVVALDDTKIPLKLLSKHLNAPQLRFASPELMQEHLGVTPGSVTPFGLMNDKKHVLTVILDAALLACPLVGFHPLTNTATTTITPSDLKKFIAHCGNGIREVDFSTL